MKATLTAMTAVAMLGMAGTASAQVFSNPAAITIPSSGTATPYPSDITVFGMGAGPWDVNVTLTGLSHTFPDDIDILLVGPTGNLILMSDVGGSADAVGVTYVFSDGAALMADGALNASGTYAATNFGAGDTFGAPAPAPSAGTSLDALGAGAVNGTWSLYVVDDLGGDLGSIAGGWSIEFSAIPAPGAFALLGLAGLVGSRRRRVA